MVMLRVLISLECKCIYVLNVNTRNVCDNYLFLKKKKWMDRVCIMLIEKLVGKIIIAIICSQEHKASKCLSYFETIAGKIDRR